MGARPPTAGSVLGAREIQKNFAARTRLIVGAVAAAIAVAIAAQLTTSDFSFPAATVGAWLTILVLLVGLLQGRGLLLPVGVAVLTCLTLLEFLYGTLATVQAVLIGGALLATAEFGYWSFELQATVPRHEQAIVVRTGVILALTFASVAMLGAGAVLAGVLR